MVRRNQHKPRPPDTDIREPLTKFYRLGLSDVHIAELLKFHYDTTTYGLSVITVRRLRKEWKLSSTRQQKHTVESIYDRVQELRMEFPLRGAESIRKALLRADVHAPRELIGKLLNIVEPEEVKRRRKRGFKRRHFWAAGVNDVWPQDQHDKWGRFGLYLHAGIEAFSGEINWLKIWHTNKNPRLIAKYYLDTCRRIGGVPIITQSDPGTENYGVANAHTSIRHRLDPSLANTLQHRFAKGHNNILSEIKWSVFRRDFSPGFEDVLQEGVNNGWYDVNNSLEKLTFIWLAVPWLQLRIDEWVAFKNGSAPRAIKHKILPHGIPCVIRTYPKHYNAVDFKIPVPSELLDEMEVEYAPPDHPVFNLVPPVFHARADNAYTAIGQPDVTVETFWSVYRDVLQQLRQRTDETLTEVLSRYEDSCREDDDDMPLLPNVEPFRLGRPLIERGNTAYIGGLDESESLSSVAMLCPEYADFTTDEEEDEMA